jgi:hypothetical protein
MFVAARREKPPGRKTEALEEFRIDSPADDPNATNETIGNSHFPSERCTNGCTCERCLMHLATILREHATADQLRFAIAILLQDSTLFPGSAQPSKAGPSVGGSSRSTNKSRKR